MTSGRRPPQSPPPGSGRSPARDPYATQPAPTGPADPYATQPAPSGRRPTHAAPTAGTSGSGRAPTASTPPRRFGSYEIGAQLGQGGMGAVYHARHLGLDRHCVIKVLLAQWDPRHREELLRRFLAEARTAARLKHPHIVAVFDAGELNGRPFIAMEFVEGSSLRDRIDAGGLDPDQVARWTAEVASALDHAHEQGIVHRDVKPDNVLIDTTGNARLVDFGIAKTTQSTGLTQSGVPMGTLSYMAPEQAEDASRAGPPADVYGLGAVLYDALTGRPPHVGETPTNIIASLLTQDPPKPRELVPDVDRGLEVICLQALARDPAKRYPSASALEEALRSWRRGERKGPKAPSRRSRVSAAEPVSRKVVAGGALAGAAMILFAAGLLATLGSRGEPLAEASAPSPTTPAAPPAGPPPVEAPSEPATPGPQPAAEIRPVDVLTADEDGGFTVLGPGGEALGSGSIGGTSHRIRTWAIGDVDGRPGDEVVLVGLDKSSALGLVVVARPNGEVLQRHRHVGHPSSVFLADVTGDRVSDVVVGGVHNVAGGYRGCGLVYDAVRRGEAWHRWDFSVLGEAVFALGRSGGNLQLEAGRRTFRIEPSGAVGLVPPAPFRERWVLPIDSRLGARPRKVAIADFNGDGRPDLAVPLYRERPRRGRLLVMLHSEEGGWQRHELESGARPFRAAAADLDGDRVPELIVLHQDPEDGAWVYRFEAGGFERTRQLPGPEGSSGQDVVGLGGAAEDAWVECWLGGGARVVRRGEVVGELPGDHQDVVRLAAGDWDGDGRVDLAGVTAGRRVILWQASDEGPGFRRAYAGVVGDRWVGGYLSLGSPGSGELQLTTQQERSGERFLLRFDPRRGQLETRAPLHRSEGEGAWAGAGSLDIDGDGRMDHVAVNEGGLVHVDLAVGETQALALSPGAEEVAVGDVDGDGRDDLVVSNQRARVLHVLLSRSPAPEDAPQETLLLLGEGGGGVGRLVSTRSGRQVGEDLTNLGAPSFEAAWGRRGGEAFVAVSAHGGAPAPAAVTHLRWDRQGRLAAQEQDSDSPRATHRGIALSTAGPVITVALARQDPQDVVAYELDPSALGGRAHRTAQVPLGFKPLGLATYGASHVLVSGTGHLAFVDLRGPRLLWKQPGIPGDPGRIVHVLHGHYAFFFGGSREAWVGLPVGQGLSRREVLRLPAPSAGSGDAGWLHIGGSRELALAAACGTTVALYLRNADGSWRAQAAPLQGQHLSDAAFAGGTCFVVDRKTNALWRLDASTWSWEELPARAPDVCETILALPISPRPRGR